MSGMPTGDAVMTDQAKLDLLHDTRQAFGRTALILQGGAIFGLCHIGVVKALHLRGLLPRIIGGTATGALIAALVGVHTESELLGFLTGDAIDLSAFEAARHGKAGPRGQRLKPRNAGDQGLDGDSKVALVLSQINNFLGMTGMYMLLHSCYTSTAPHKKKQALFVPAYNCSSSFALLTAMFALSYCFSYSQNRSS